MKLITIEISDEMYAELEALRHTDHETVESIARALLFDNMYEDEIHGLWASIDDICLELDEEDTELFHYIDRISEILVMCAYSVNMPSELGLEYLEKFEHLLAGFKEGSKGREDIVEFKNHLEDHFGSEYPEGEYV